jgi:DNA-binding NarL/FixJ family response regulator
MTMNAVKVAVHAADPITQIGLIGHIRHEPGMTPATAPEAADIAVVAVGTADGSTVELLRSLSGCPADSARFVLIVDGECCADLATLAECGVRAVLRRADFSPSAFVRALRAVSEGKADLPPMVQGQLLDQVERVQREILSPRGLTASGLTSREIDVLRLASEGLELSEIAFKMCYSERTIKNILYGVMNRLGLRNRVHAVSYAIRNGLI